MPPWLESHADLRDHPKVDLLMDLLAVTRRDAVGLLHFIWWRTLTYAPSGDLSDFTDGQIARWADWDGDPGHLISALTTAGFMDESRTVHDWEDFAGRWIDRRQADAARKRDARKAAADRDGVGRPGTSAGRPTRVGAPARAPGPDLTGPDLTGPDRTPPSPTPQPPSPQAGPGARPRRKRRADTDLQDAPAAPVDLTPATPEDVATWDQARAELAVGWLPANVEKLAALVPIGRGPDGGLHLRAPPWADGPRYRHQVARALLDAGDAAGERTVIVEASAGTAGG
jgi:hypothetical protein